MGRAGRRTALADRSARSQICARVSNFCHFITVVFTIEPFPQWIHERDI